jgi:hypothetical protein
LFPVKEGKWNAESMDPYRGDVLPLFEELQELVVLAHGLL